MDNKIMEIIIPCAGLSTRFPGLRPKYLLCDYSGKMMIENAAKNYIGKYPVTLVILKQHDLEYNAVYKLNERFNNQVKIIVLDEPTTGPAHTVYEAVKRGGFDLHASMLVKDCDGFYDAPVQPGNVIYTAKLSKHPHIRNPGAKSFTITNDQDIINNVIEKQIVSDNFCVGGYQFEHIENYIKAYEEIKKTSSEIFISNIVDYMISNGLVFIESEVFNFIDVGTKEDWLEFNNKPTYFCDIDGTLVRTGFEQYYEWEPITKNIDVLLKEHSRGCQIIFTTSRPERFRELTRKMLDQLGFVGTELIMNLHHSKRILINDYANSNPYPSAVAYNIKRDDDCLRDLL